MTPKIYLVNHGFMSGNRAQVSRLKARELKILPVFASLDINLLSARVYKSNSEDFIKN